MITASCQRRCAEVGHFERLGVRSGFCVFVATLTAACAPARSDSCACVKHCSSVRGLSLRGGIARLGAQRFGQGSLGADSSIAVLTATRVRCLVLGPCSSMSPAVGELEMRRAQNTPAAGRVMSLTRCPSLWATGRELGTSPRRLQHHQMLNGSPEAGTRRGGPVDKDTRTREHRISAESLEPRDGVHKSKRQQTPRFCVTVDLPVRGCGFETRRRCDQPTGHVRWERAERTAAEVSGCSLGCSGLSRLTRCFASACRGQGVYRA